MQTSTTADVLATAAAAAAGAAVALLIVGGSLLFVLPAVVGVGAVAFVTRRRAERTRRRGPGTQGPYFSPGR